MKYKITDENEEEELYNNHFTKITQENIKQIKSAKLFSVFQEVSLTIQPQHSLSVGMTEP
jgi:hypothetical protein